jgi:carbonic anhydrase
MLMNGCRRFVDGTAEHPNQDAARRADLALGQAPFAVLFGCFDSRLAAEIIFDQGLGDLFVVRTAGHVIGPEALGSTEYGPRPWKPDRPPSWAWPTVSSTAPPN